MTSIQYRRASYITLVAPAFLVYAAVIIFPIAYTAYLSFVRWQGFGIPQWVGLANYTRMLTDPIFLHGLRNNLLVVGISVFGQIPLGFVLAYVIYRRMVRAEKFFEVMIFLPITISPVVVAILWNQIFSPAGAFTAIVRALAGNPSYVMRLFEDRTLAIVPILFVILWMYTGLYMVIYLANLQRIDPEIIESATIDGASEPQIFGRIVLPAMVNIIFTTTVFAVSGSLKSFDLIWAFTQGGPAHYTEVIAIYMYRHTFRFYNYGLGASTSMAIIILSVVLIYGLRTIARHFERRYE